MMVTIDDMQQCITTFLHEGGYVHNQRDVWTDTGKFDSKLSTLTTVHRIKFTNNFPGIFTQYSSITITEAWVFQSYRGCDEWPAKIQLDKGIHTIKTSTIKSIQSLSDFLRENFPTGTALSSETDPIKRQIEAESDRQQKLDSNIRKTNSCIDDGVVLRFIQTLVAQLKSNQINSQTFPDVKHAFKDLLHSKIDKWIDIHFDSLLVESRFEMAQINSTLDRLTDICSRIIDS